MDEPPPAGPSRSPRGEGVPAAEHDAAVPIQRSRRPAHLRRSQARPPSDIDAPRLRNAVGGHMVNSMKRGRGLRPSRLRAYRVWILGFVALALMLALNAAWLSRISRNIQSHGGWSSILDAARGHIAAWFGRLAVLLEPGSRPQRDEM